MDYDLPAWDRIEGIPDPLENRILVGHEDLMSRLADTYASGRMHHAWLLTGPAGIGKATLAARFAGHVFRHPEPSSAPAGYVAPREGDPTEARVRRGAHPNLLVLRRPWNDKDRKWRQDLTVDEVRRTVSFFGTSAGEGGWRVAVVDTADDLNSNAANALLKVLEEPPPRTVFLVLAHAPRGQLATIRSRCVKLQVRPLADDRLVEALRGLEVAQDIEAGDLELAAKLAGGSVRRAILLLREDGIELYRSFARLAADARPPDWAAIHALATEVSGPSRERFRLLLEIVEDYVSRRIRGQDEPEGGHADAQRAISVLAGGGGVGKTPRRSAELADAYNLDRKQVVLNLFNALKESA
mgnify:CR=1 FL=1